MGFWKIKKHMAKIGLTLAKRIQKINDHNVFL